MAKIFSDENGNIGTIIVLKGRPEDYLPETHTYHGEHEILDSHIREALVVNNGVLEHDIDKLKAYKKREVDETYLRERALVREELHDALLDGDSDADIQIIKDKVAVLKTDMTAALNIIDGYMDVSDIVNVDTSNLPIGAL